MENQIREIFTHIEQKYAIGYGLYTIEYTLDNSGKMHTGKC